jgi:hypothetical protein
MASEKYFQSDRNEWWETFSNSALPTIAWTGEVE